MLYRTFFAITTISIIILSIKLFRVWQHRAAQHTASNLTTQSESQIIYFSSTACSQCAGQERILNQVIKESEFVNVVLKKYAIENDAELAQQWGVTTLPTTILLSNLGVVRRINNGLISASTLITQLRELKTN